MSQGAGASGAEGDDPVLRNVVVQVGSLRIRRMRDSEHDYALLVRWLNQPHVREWWDPDDPPATLASVRREHAAATGPDPATTACIIELGRRPVGFIQFYRWAASPDDAELIGGEVGERDWGLDILIGEPDLVGKGIGTLAVDLVCRQLMGERRAESVMLLTEVTNARAQRAYEKAGFRRVREVLDVDRRDGERVRSYLMRRDAAGERNELPGAETADARHYTLDGG